MDNPVITSTLRGIGLVTALLGRDTDDSAITIDFLRDVVRNDGPEAISALCIGLANLGVLLTLSAAAGEGKTPEALLQGLALSLEGGRP